MLFKPPSLWYFGTAVLENQYRGQELEKNHVGSPLYAFQLYILL